MIQVSSLSKQYGSHQVLRDVSIEIPRGSVSVLVGHNGCGKTTLMKCLLSLTHPTSGQMLFDGKPSDELDTRRRLGYMPQAAHYPENISGREWLGLIAGVRKREADDAERLIEVFELQSELDKPLGTLSGGTNQKLSAVIALMYKPQFLLMDEPTAGLDPISRIRLKDLIADARSSGCTVLLTSHVLSEVDELCDHLFWLDEGQIRYSGTAESVRQATGETKLDRALARLMSDDQLHSALSTQNGALEVTHG